MNIEPLSHHIGPVKDKDGHPSGEIKVSVTEERKGKSGFSASIVSHSGSNIGSTIRTMSDGVVPGYVKRPGKYRATIHGVGPVLTKTVTFEC